MVRATWLLMSGVLVTLLIAVPSTAYPSMNNYFNEDGPYDPENIEELINRIGNLIRLERKMESYKDYDIPNSKRTFDLGLGRGYTGTVQAKHLMGIAAANYAGGPGRRRRDAN